MGQREDRPGKRQRLAGPAPSVIAAWPFFVVPCELPGGLNRGMVGSAPSEETMRQGFACLLLFSLECVCACADSAGLSLADNKKPFAKAKEGRLDAFGDP